MSLRDTLNRNAEERRRKEEFEKKIPEMLEERKAIAKKICDQIKDWLFEYERDGLAKIETINVQVVETGIASYESTGVHMTFQERKIKVEPAGRSFTGDFLLDIKDPRNRGESRFFISVGENKISLLDLQEKHKNRVGNNITDELEWSKENLEFAIDELVKIYR